jgi:hypothetical protein
MRRCDRSFIPCQLFQQHLPRINLLLQLLDAIAAYFLSGELTSTR